MPKYSNASDKEKSRHRVVVIGGSAGSIELIITLINSLSENTRLSLVVVVHRMRNINSHLENIFLTKSKIRAIREVEEKEPVEPGTVYVAPSNYHLLFEENGTFSLDYSEPVNYSRPSIDVSFQSAADVLKDRLVLILLSGANDDGASGMQYAKERGALTIVQDPDEAEYPVMPMSAIKEFKPDYILGIKEICNLLTKLDI